MSINGSSCISTLATDKNFIALFASGNSLLELTNSEFGFIKKKAFVITTNYAPLHFTGHMNCWSDKSVSNFLEEFYKENPKNCLFFCKNTAFSNDSSLKSEVDYWFNNKAEKLEGNFTAGWLLQMVSKYFQEKTILLFGWDFYVDEKDKTYKWYDKFTDFDAKKRGRSGRKVTRKLNSFKDQVEKFNLNHPRIINCNPQSALERFPKKDWRSILKPNVLHLASSPLAGAPAHLSNILNKYTDITSKSILKNTFERSRSLNKLSWDYDIEKPTSKEIEEMIKWSDIVHYHNRVFQHSNKDSSSLIQFHSPPSNYQPNSTFGSFNGRKLVIGQYHPRFYQDAHIVPNLIDIWDPLYMPGEKPQDRVKIFYSWAFEGSGWSSKGSKKTQEILQQIKKKYGNKVEVVVFHNEPYGKCMQEKQTAHICIDECVTGSYHLQSLEGCSVKALTFNNIDEKTASYLQHITGANEHPFEKCGLANLFDRLCYFIENTKELHKRQVESRQWMEKFWDPKKLSRIFENIYHNIIAFGTINPQKDQRPASQSFEKYNVQRQSNPSAIPQNGQRENPLVNRRQRHAKRTPSKKRKMQKQNRGSGSKIFYQVNGASSNYSGNFTLQIGKPIQKLYRLHEGKDIYIFGTGPSLLKCDPEFYKNQICMGINFAFEKMPYINYHLFHVLEVYEALKPIIPYYKMILPETLVKQHHKGVKDYNLPNRVIPENNQAYIYPLQDPFDNQNFNNKHVSLAKDTRFFTWSSAMHSAIHIAAYMGAKNIYLIGVDYKNFPDGSVHFDTPYYPEYGQQDWAVHQKHKKGDQWLKEQLSNHGIHLENISSQLSQKKRESKVS